MAEWRKTEATSLDLVTLQRLIRLVEQEDLAELIIQKGEEMVIIRGRSFRSPQRQGIKIPLAVSPPLAEEEHLFPIIAPLTGTFYSRPHPDAPPFVTVGAEVEEGQVVALVEAMKVFNEVRSGVRGSVQEILVKDGQLVQHGDVLMILRRSE